MLFFNIIGDFIIILLVIFLLFYSPFKNKFLFNNNLLRSLVNKVIPKKNSNEYKNLEMLIKSTYIKSSIEDIYSIKIATLFFVCIFSIMIFFTNTAIQKQHIFNSPIKGYITESIYNNSKLRQNNYHILKKYCNLNSKNAENNFVLVRDSLMKYGNISNEHIKTFTNIAIKDFNNIEKLYSFYRILKYMIFSIISFFLPDLFLKIYAKIKNKHIEKETYKLTNLLYIIASNDNITTKNILNSLVINSYHLRQLLQKFQMTYLINREDAYKKSIESSYLKPISRITSLLRQIEESDKQLALNNIRHTNENFEKVRKISYENKIEQKEAAVLILFALGALMVLKAIVDFSVNGLSNIQNF